MTKLNRDESQTWFYGYFPLRVITKYSRQEKISKILSKAQSSSNNLQFFSPFILSRTYSKTTFKVQVSSTPV